MKKWLIGASLYVLFVLVIAWILWFLTANKALVFAFLGGTVGVALVGQIGGRWWRRKNPAAKK